MISFLFTGQMFSQNKSSHRGEWRGKLNRIWFHQQSREMKISFLYLYLRACCRSGEAKLHNAQPRAPQFWSDVSKMRCTIACLCVCVNCLFNCLYVVKQVRMCKLVIRQGSGLILKGAEISCLVLSHETPVGVSQSWALLVPWGAP